MAARHTYADDYNETDGIDALSNPTSPTEIYTLSGIKVNTNGESVQQVLGTLPRGIYLVGGKKVVIR